MKTFNRKNAKIFDKNIGKGLIEVMRNLVFSEIPIIEAVDSVIDVCRNMKVDKLIQEKELAELEAKIDCYIEYTDFYRDALNRCYELENKELELIQMISNKVVLLLEKVDGLEEDSIKMKVYLEQINRHQMILEKMVDSSGKYYNEKIMEANRIDIPEFIRYTEIGKHQNRKNLNNMREAEYV